MNHRLNTPQAADKAASAVDLVEGDARRGKCGRDVWVVVTSSYRVDFDPDSPDGRQRHEALRAGRVDLALRGLEAAHTEVVVRTPLDATAPG